MELPGPTPEFKRTYAADHWFVGFVEPHLTASGLRSAMLVIARGDGLYGRVLWSTGLEPRWPHLCDDSTTFCADCRPVPEPEFAGPDVDLAFAELFEVPVLGHRVVDERPFVVGVRVADGMPVSTRLIARHEPWILGDAPPPVDLADEALLDAVFADPEDDAPRAVLADVLVDRGDPRGQFIADQLAGALGEPGLAWRTPLHAVATAVEYRRGFPYRVTAYFPDQPTLHGLGNDACWATVRELDFHTGSAQAITPAMGRLQVVENLSSAGLDSLLNQRHRLDTLRTGLDGLRDVDKLAWTELPALRLLDLATSADVAQALRRLERATWWPTVRHLSLFSGDLGDSLDLNQVLALAPALETLTYGGDTGVAIRWRVTGGAPVEAQVVRRDRRDWRHWPARRAGRVLRRLPPLPVQFDPDISPPDRATIRRRR